jgi:hypothetical protein
MISQQKHLSFDLYLDSELSKNSGFQAHYNANQNQTILVVISITMAN